MHVRILRWGALATVLALFVGGCDLTTESPSLNTETELDAPIVADKTFSFLGGPSSPKEPLIDTTSASFDSLFTVGTGADRPENSIFVEQEVSSFDIGSLDQAIDEAAEGVGVNQSLAEALVEGNDLASQSVEAEYSKTNQVPPPLPEDGASEAFPLPSVGGTTFPFPAEFLRLPEFDVVAADGDVQYGALTDSTQGTVAGERVPVNEITFVLENNGSNSTRLTREQTGNAPPRVSLVRGSDTLRNAAGEKAAANFGEGPVENGTERSVTLNVQGTQLGEVGGQQTKIVLKVAGQESRDRLTTEISPFEYEEVALQNVSQLRVQASQENIDAARGTDTRFAGLNVGSGSITLDITNNLQFPVSIDTLELQNDTEAAMAPAALSRTGIDAPGILVFESQNITGDGGTKTVIQKDMSGNGIASVIDIPTLSASLNQGEATEPIVVGAGDGLDVSLTSPDDLAIQTLYFWPDGETLRKEGSVSFDPGDRLDFRQGDFVRLESGTIALEGLDYVQTDEESDVGLTFESFQFTYPDLAPPEMGTDSLQIRFEGQTSNPDNFNFEAIRAQEGPRSIEASAGGVTIRPAYTTQDGQQFTNRVRYSAQANLGTVPEGQETENNLVEVGIDDSVRAAVNVRDLTVQEVRAQQAENFAVNVTEDENGDGTLDLDTEAKEVSFDGFQGIADRIEDLRLNGGELQFSVETNLGTDASLYAAIQGRQDANRTYLAGTADTTRVPSDDPRGDDFTEDGTPVASTNLVQLSFPGAPVDALADGVSRAVTLTGGNSTVDRFISALPTALRFVGKAYMTGNENGRLLLQRPVSFDAGLDVSVPLSFEGTFTVRDTVDADFSSLEDVTDPDENVTLSSAALKVQYKNALPLGADAEMTVVDGNGTPISDIDPLTFSIEPALKNAEGEAQAGAGVEGTATINLGTSREELSALTDGQSIRFELTMTQQDGESSARLRTDDTLQLSLRADVKASVGSGN